MAPLVDEPMADTRDMRMAHTALRREFRLLPDVIRSVAPGDTRRAEVVGAHAALMCRVLDTHHEGEDKLLWPKLRERAGVDAEVLVPTMEQQHAAIERLLTEVTALLGPWRSGARGGERLAGVFERLLTVLLRHLALEEKEILPLAAKHVSAAEWRELRRYGTEHTPKKDLPLVLGMAMYEGDPEVARAVLATLPLPLRTIVPVLGPRRYAAHARQVHGTVRPARVGS